MKLLVLDVEGTLFEPSVALPGTTLRSTIWQAIASALGPAALEEELATHRKWHAGGYPSYLDWMKATIEIHLRHGLTAQVFTQLIESARWNPGVNDAIDSVDRAAFEPVLVSGGFRSLALRVQVRHQIRHAFTACDYVFNETGRLVAYNLLPCDFAGKIDFVRLMLREYGLEENAWVFVGDGDNDIPIAQVAPLSVAYGTNTGLADVADHAIDSFAELGPILGESEAVVAR